VIVTPLGTDGWRSSQFEPLILGLCLPLCRYPFWRLRNTRLMDQVERKMHGNSFVGLACFTGTFQAGKDIGFHARKHGVGHATRHWAVISSL